MKEALSLNVVRNGRPPSMMIVPSRRPWARRKPSLEGFEFVEDFQFLRPGGEEPEERAIPPASERVLRYEIMEEAGVVQARVIDARDGRVVREFPTDEAIEFIEHMKKQMDMRL